jgi:hypothetical protein
MVDTDIQQRPHQAVRPGRAYAAVIGLVLPVIYLVFAVAAYLQYPSSFSPLGNWLSDLGNRELNPDGACFYIVGCALTGALLIAFYLSLRTWAPSGTTRQQRQLSWMQGFGALAGFAPIMTAAFPQDRLGPHLVEHHLVRELCPGPVPVGVGGPASRVPDPRAGGGHGRRLPGRRCLAAVVPDLLAGVADRDPHHGAHLVAERGHPTDRRPTAADCV